MTATSPRRVESQQLFDKNSMRFKVFVGTMRRAKRILSALIGSIFAKDRWVRVTEEEFLRRVPSHVLGQAKTYDLKYRNGKVVQWRAQHFTSPDRNVYHVWMVRHREDIILPDWHIAVMKRLRKWEYNITPAFSSEIHKAGMEIIALTRSGDTRWLGILKEPLAAKETQV